MTYTQADLDKAADFITANGMFRGGYYNGRCTCALGALVITKNPDLADGKPFIDSMQSHDNPNVEEWLDALEELDDSVAFGLMYLIDLNDTGTSNPLQVAQAIRDLDLFLDK